MELTVREEYISFSNTDLVSAKMTRSSAKRKQLICSSYNVTISQLLISAHNFKKMREGDTKTKKV